MSISPEQLLETALHHGAEAAEVYGVSSVAYPVYFEANRLKQLEFVDSQGVGLRLWRQGKPGMVVAYGAADPVEIVEKAMAISELNEPEERYLPASLDIDYQNHFGEATDTKVLIEEGNNSIQMMRDRYPEVLCSGQWQCSTDQMRLINSAGLDCQFTETSIDAFLSVEWTRGDDFLNVYTDQSAPHFFSFAASVEKLVQYLDWAAENTRAPQGKVPVLFTPKAIGMLWSPISLAMSGKQVQQKATPWLDKRGQKVISELLTLSQKPAFAQFYLPFDDEGTPTEVFTWLDRGHLQDFYADRKIAQELQLTCRGNGFRAGLGSYPAPGLFNGIVEPGNRSLLELIGGIESGILIDQILGGGPGISGDFSINIELGYRIEKGAIVGRVKDTMIAGNAYTALQEVIALGNDNEWQGSLFVPSAIVDSLSVSSKMSENDAVS